MSPDAVRYQCGEHDHRDPHPGAARPAAVGALPLDDRDRARHGLDPRRARGHDRRQRSPRGSPRRAAGLALDAGQIGTAAAFYVARRLRRRAVLRPAHRPVRPQEAVPAHARALHRARRSRTAFSFSALYFFVAASSPAPGIGGEYAAINSAIDELIPARVRGRVDLIINGSYWLGAAVGALLAIVLLDTSALRRRRRLAARVRDRRGARRSDPARAPQRAGEPALAVHPRPRGGGRADRRRDRARRSTRRPARSSPEPDESITVRQRETIPFREIARTAFTTLPAPHGARPVRCSSARRSSTTRSPSTSAPCSASSSASRPARCPSIYRDLRGRQLPRPAAARAAVRHGRPQADDRRHLPRLGRR